MALTTNKIGIFTFVSLQGQMVPPATVKIPYDRPGVDGTEFVLAGRKGRPFVLVSTVDDEDLTAAQNTLSSYQDLIGEDAQEVVKGGVSSSSLGYKCVVLDVQEVACGPIRGASGYLLSSQAQAYLTAQWTLQAVPLEA